MVYTDAASGFNPLTVSSGIRRGRPRENEILHPDYEIQEPDWKMMSDTFAGAGVVRLRAQTEGKYLIRTELEEKDAVGQADTTKKSRYQQRLERSPYVNGIERLTRFAMANLFREFPIIPEVDELPDKLKPLLKNTDLLGTTFPQFMRNVSTSAYVMGHFFVLVDMPDARNVESLEEENKLDIRPYFLPIDPRDILNWSIAKTEDGRFEFEWVVHRIQQFISPGPFEEHVHKVAYKVWYKDRWELFEEAEEGTNTVLTSVDRGENPIGRVPIVPIYSNIIRPMISQPPLLEAANLNLDHYNMNSMLVNGMMFHLSPLLAFMGAKNEDIVQRGADYAVFLPQTATVEYVEFSGSSMEVAKTIVDQIGVEVVESGLRNTSFLGANTSAEARRLARSDFNSFHQAIAHNYNLAFTEMLEVAGLWIDEKLTEKQSRVKINTDFDVVMIDAAMSAFLLNARSQGDISRRRFMKELERGEVLTKGLNIDEEIAEAVKDGPSLTGLTAAQISGTSNRSGSGSTARGRTSSEGGQRTDDATDAE